MPCEGNALLAHHLRTEIGGHEPLIPIRLGLYERWRGHRTWIPGDRQRSAAGDSLGMRSSEDVGDSRAPVVAYDREALQSQPVRQLQHVLR